MTALAERLYAAICTHPGAAMVKRVNEVVRGWVNYFRVGHASRAFAKVRYFVELKVRRFAMRHRKRSGFGWKRWSSQVVYGSWGLFADQLTISKAAARATSNGPITLRG